MLGKSLAAPLRTTALVSVLILELLIAACSPGAAGEGQLLQPVPAIESSAPQLPAPLPENPAPAGVDQKLWERLASALEQSQVLNSRSSSIAPAGLQNMVTDLQVVEAGAGSAEITWSYRNTGDYDQNSQVNISDLTAIGLHFGKSDTSPDWPTARLADGDGNGLITIADVTPIGANFGSVLSRYSVQRQAGGTGEFSEIGSLAQASGTSSPGSPGLRFTYLADGLASGDVLQVVPHDLADGSFGMPSNEVVFTSAVRPENLQASQGSFAGEVQLSWDPVEEAEGYRVERRHLSMTVFDVLGDTGEGVTTFSDADVEPGQVRIYRVAAILDGNPGSYSDSASGFSMPLPDTPLNPTASLGTVEAAVQLGWEAVANADGYRVYRDAGPDPVADVQANFYMDEESNIPGDHQYVVTAYNEAGESGPSVQVTGSAGVVPDAPSGFNASDATNPDAVELAWTKSEYAVGYRIYRDSDNNMIAELGDTSLYIDSGLQDFEEHDYWISAFTPLGESGKTGPEQGSRLLLPPAAPLNVQASKGSFRDAVRISWNQVGNADQYFIYRDGNPTAIGSVGKTDHYDDLSVPDLEAHSYTVRSGNSAGTSELSSPASGFADNRSDWWRFGRDNAASSRSTAAGPASNSLAWSYPTGSWIRCNPVMAADGTVYFGNYAGQLVALKQDGSEKWTYTAGADIYTAPAIAADGTVYVGSHDSNLHAVNSNGSQKWTYTTGGIVRSSPAIDPEGRIYFGSQDFKLYCLDPDGNLEWSYTCGEEVRSSPAIGPDGTVYVGTGKENKLVAINSDGTFKWQYDAGGWVRSSPAIAADGTVYVGSSNGKLHAVDSSGNMKWVFSASDYIENCSPAIGADDRVYIGSGDDRLYCINPADGNLLWEYVTGADIDSSPAIDGNGTIYVGSDDGKMHAVNPNGSGKWTYSTGDLVDSGPMVGEDGRIYFGSKDGSLYCVGPTL